MAKTAAYKRILAAAGALFLLLALLWPAFSVRAAGDAIRDIDITIELGEDGTAYITEVWDVTKTSGTEWYLGKYNLEQRDITDFTVSDETGRVYENVGAWNVDWTQAQKADKCGMVAAQGGYELCWGVGTYGDHVFTASYTMTNAVMGYEGADALYLRMVNDQLSSNPEHVKVTVRYPGHTLSADDTGIWAFGFTGDASFADGVAVFESSRKLRSSEYAVVLMEFYPGMIHPQYTHSRSFSSLLEQAMKGSDYDTGDAGLPWNNVSQAVRSIVFPAMGVLVLPLVFIVLSFVVRSAMGNPSVPAQSWSRRAAKKQYQDGSYSRNIPYAGNMPATYARLDELHSLENEGVIIGAFLLKWVQTKQVELMRYEARGFFSSKEEDAIKLYSARPEMEPMERQLYDMLLAASGNDYILQSKEFEKWSRKKYSRVEGWLEQYKNQGKAVMHSMGATTQVQHRVFFGLIPTTRMEETPLGEQLTREMFGFKKYLEDFTIINEREAREVQLWGEYLVYAQLFGIADRVAEQFKQLYPDYFVQMAQHLGYSNVSMFDIIMINRISRSFGQAMYSGYRAGYNAAHTSSSSGGGGSFSGGGGGGAGGGGSGGGSR